MLLLKFIVFACFVAGSYCRMSVDCFMQARLECSEYIMEKPELPNSIEDVRIFCSNVIPLGRCQVGVMEKCAKDENMWDTDEEVENTKNMLKFIESTCDEDSRLFKVIKDNLICMSDTFEAMDDICYWSNINESYVQELRNLVGEEKEGCAIDSWPFHCMVARFDLECGNDVRDAVVEIFENIDFFSIWCKEKRQALSYFQEAFRDEFERGTLGDEALDNIFEVIREKEA